MRKFYEVIVNHRKTVIVVFFISVVICALCGTMVNVNYDMNDYLPDGTASTVALDTMNKEYDMSIPNARVMISDVSISEALDMKQKLLDIDGVDDVTWLDDVVDTDIPLGTQDKDVVENYYKDNNALFTVTVDEQTRLETVNTIRKLIGDENSMSGSAVNTAVATQATNSEIKKIISYVYSAGAEVPMDYVESDVLNKLISKNYSRMVLTVDAVFLVLLITMKSISIPIILVLAIETAIWINLSIPYFSGNFLFYISYLIISSVQLGATVDYAILFTTRYLENRKVLPKRESIVDTIKTTTVSIMTSASILTLAGVLLWKISTHGVLSQLGHLLGRGTVLSTIIVLFVIPGILYIFDTLIRKTTVGANFYEGKPEKKKSEKREIKEVKESY